MGERPRFNHSGTVIVTRQRHHQQAKHAGPTLRHWVWTGEEAGGCRGGCPAPEGPLRREGTAVVVPLSPPALPSPMAAVVKDPFLEEWREFTNGVFRKHQPHFVDV